MPDTSYKADLLADAFSTFIAASGKLENSYAYLQQEVTQLRRELAERNEALKASIVQNVEVHNALKQIVHSLPCGVMVVESDKSVSLSNPEALRLLEMEAATQLDISCTADAASAASAVNINLLLDNDQGDIEQEFCTSSQGKRRWTSVRKKNIRRVGDADGLQADRTQTILILRDVTAQKDAEDERERNRRATALSEVAATLAHEVRNPLASMELFASLLAEGGEKSAEWLSHLHAGIRSLTGTVNNVLSLHGVGFPVTGPIDLVRCVRNSCDFVRPIASQSGVALDFASDAEVLPVWGNGSGIQQLVLNFVCNAVRHTPAGGAISVTVRRQYKAGAANGVQQVVLEVTDNGTGIKNEDLPRIFELGFSGGSGTSGLGLSVCAQIVQQHSGTIRVESTRGTGTSFFVEIPVL